MAGELYAPSFRLQDELHLLRDSLGAINAHYESLLDHLQSSSTDTHAKIVGSSATLSGFERQCDQIYRRHGRVFPLQGPSIHESLWSGTSTSLLRRFIALAPRGVTLEFAADRMLTSLQSAIRELVADPVQVCTSAGIPTAMAAELVSLYGTDVVYGNTIRDLDASLRSLETQVPVGKLITAQLTGQTLFSEVSKTLERLERPEPDFQDRVHVVAASAMMSHGVDIDRLNVMVMLGLPLATAEFIQTTARIGRKHPGLVFVLHKMALERDASVYRSFRHFVEQGDRFVDPVPVSRRSQRVLERTLCGLVQARLLHIHETRAGKPLTTVRALREYQKAGALTELDELTELKSILGLDSDLDSGAVEYLREWLHDFFRNLNNPDPSAKFPSDLSPTGKPMTSLRDVEEQAPIHDA
jgi:hypothetical protein